MCLAGMSSACGTIRGLMVSRLLDEAMVMVAVLGVNCIESVVRGSKQVSV